MDDVNKVLDTRGNTHGDYNELSRVSVSLRNVLMSGVNWGRLTPGQQEALNMHCVKIARIVTGDPNFDEHWLDIEGYSRLARTRSKSGLSPEDIAHIVRGF